MNWFEKRMKELGYKGCRNCKHQIDVLRACEWLENGGDGALHLICPKWDKREVSDCSTCPTAQNTNLEDDDSPCRDCEVE